MFELRFVLGHDDATTDLLASFDDRTTVGDLVDRLVDRYPVTWGGAATLERLSRTRATLARDLPLAQADLQSGDAVRLAPDSGLRDPGRRRLVGRARVVTTDSAPRWVEIPAGETIIGRSVDVDVAIDDDLLSRRHAKLVASDVIEVVDLGSTNGTAVNGVAVVAPRRLRNGDEIRIGDTTLFVEQAEAALGDVLGPSVEFNRPPRIQRPLPQARIELPAPPEKPGKQRLPMAAALAPLAMGGIMWAFGMGILTMVFFALSPLMVMGSFWDAKRSGRADYAERLEVFEEDRDRAVAAIESAQDTEVEARFAASPAVNQLDDHVRDLSPRLWEREPGDPDFLQVRLGLAPQPARIDIALPTSGGRELREELAAIPRRYADLPPVPVAVGLARTGSIGVSGPDPFASHAARSIVAQVTALHSPSEVVVCALLSEPRRADWEWLTWLPHTRAPLSPIGVNHLAATVDDALALLKDLGTTIEQRIGDDRDSRDVVTTPHVVVVVDDDLPLERARLTGLLEVGPRAGIHVVWVASSGRRIPKTCGAVVNIAPGGANARIAEVDEARTFDDVPVELFDRAAAQRLARDLAPIVDVSSRQSRDVGLPGRASLVDLLGGPDLLDRPGVVRARWGESQPGGGLRGAVGAGAGGVFSIDLRHDGPHGLVAGTTGAGKSEFLQSLLVALAATHSPDKVNFLLVDYKGGAAFKDVTHLPHTVGLVTDLTQALVRRALTSLRAELHRREHLLNEANAKDQLQMEKERHPLTPPSLVIVVDEFAALATEVPEFVDGVVDVAQRGRSLGLHLLLATQRPAGVITPNIRANTNLKVALRVASEDESTDVLDSPVAATIDRSTPGRGVARLGPSELISFQAGYVGGHTGAEDTERVELEVASVGFGTVRPWPDPTRATDTDTGPTDLERLVTTITTAFRDTGSPVPRRPWLDPLAEHYDLLRLPRTGRDDRLPIGVRDDPASQSQQVAAFHPDRDGSMLVYGVGGSGKTAALRTIATAACLTDDDHPVGILGIDAAGRGLEMLSPLPQVGSLVTGDDHERVTRMLGDLAELVEERGERFMRHQAASLAEYRRNSGEAMQRILVLVDGFETFVQAWERIDRGQWLDLLLRLVGDGRGVGVHFVLTGTRRNSFPMMLTSTVGRRLVLRLATLDEYLNLGVDADLVDGDEPAGRAVDGEHVVQVALAGDDLTTAGQATTLRRLGATLQRRGARPGPEVRVLGDTVALAEVATNGTGRLGIGLTDRLEPFTLDPSDDLLITGPARSGKTTTVATLATSASRAGVPVVVFAGKRPVPGLPRGVAQHVGADDVEVAVRALAARPEPILVLVDDVHELFEGPAELPLHELMREPHVTLVATCEVSLARSAWSDVMSTLKRGRRILLLQPDSDMDASLANADLPRTRQAWPVGRAIHSDGGTLTLVQVAH
ncbi:FtsK/SpoIIIE domain-containing protein [Salsipaludibacter albus]|uniref:FtsK/SpoIIIE domain-containing protein n=1 Tax=Salsipaludibacter albus TaxID=2849650 RepID=UPI001EE460E5|nr:FtsK/SpoIIIE domain-containing protein [Salsipaludibacter albus]MBY5161296.1 FHA domain-containing protein [Salsipaludibacter albus]